MFGAVPRGSEGLGLPYNSLSSSVSGQDYKAKEIRVKLTLDDRSIKCSCLSRGQQSPEIHFLLPNYTPYLLLDGVVGAASVRKEIFCVRAEGACTGSS